MRGLENHLMIASQSIDFNIGAKWPDLEVTNWPVVECIHEPMQSDGYDRSLPQFLTNLINPYICTFIYINQKNITSCSSSCGLFMLKFMEYFTGQKLARAITQVLSHDCQFIIYKIKWYLQLINSNKYFAEVYQSL
jgi:hypothetical protein